MVTDDVRESLFGDREDARLQALPIEFTGDFESREIDTARSVAKQIRDGGRFPFGGVVGAHKKAPRMKVNSVSQAPSGRRN